MSESLQPLRPTLFQLSEPVRELLLQTRYTPPEGANVSVKSMLERLLPPPTTTSPSSNNNRVPEEAPTRSEMKDFSLCCAALASAGGGSTHTHPHLSWIPKHLSDLAASAFQALSTAFFTGLEGSPSKKMEGLGVDYGLMSDESKLAAELMPQVLPLLKESIKGSSIETSEEGDDISAASSRVPVAYAIVASYQFRWFVTQVEYPHFGRLVSLVIPCALTALDHWSPEVKGQGMISIIHLVKNMNAAELGWYEDVILDACFQNIASADEIWHLVAEMSVLLLTCTQRSNPRSSWFERMLTEMLGHLERQPRNAERRIAWLEVIDPLFSSMGLVLLAHFRRIFPLFFQWMHADDDRTVVLVLKRVHTVIKLTWIRNSPHIERLVDELAVIYKEAALRRVRQEIRTHIRQILIMLQQSKGRQFEVVWEKHRDDPNLTTLGPSLNGKNASVVV